MAADTNSYAMMLKKMYPQARINPMVYNEYPLLGLLEKKRVQGESSALLVSALVTGVNNRSATFTDSVAGAAALYGEQFAITTADNFNTVSIGHKLELQSKTNAQAFAQAVESHIKGCISTLMTDIGWQIYRSSSGSLGQLSAISATTAAATLTFSSRYALRTIEKGARLLSSTNSDLSSADTNVGTVTGVDRDLGTVTVSGSGLTNWGSASYIFHKGDVNGKFKGLADWLPSGPGRPAALTNAFFGVTRSSDATRLAGIYYDGSSNAMQDALVRGSARLYEEGAKPDICLMNPTDYASLQLEMSTRVVCATVPGQVANIGYTGIKLHGMVGNVTILPDPNCPAGLCYMLDTSTWKIAHLGQDLVNTWNEDGNTILRGAGNTLDIRIYSYMQPYCEAPGRNMVIALVQ